MQTKTCPNKRCRRQHALYQDGRRVVAVTCCPDTRPESVIPTTVIYPHGPMETQWELDRAAKFADVSLSQQFDLQSKGVKSARALFAVVNPPAIHKFIAADQGV